MVDAVRVGLDRFVLDALGSEALEERTEPGDGERDPAGSHLRRDLRADDRDRRRVVSGSVMQGLG